MFKNIKSMLYSIKLMGMESMFPFMILLMTFINIMNINIGYNMEFMDGLWSMASVVFVVVLLVTAIVVAMNYTNYYKLLVAMPMKLDKTPMQMMMLLDFTVIIVMLIDVIAMAVSGYGMAILVKTAFMFILYAAVCMLFYISVRTGFKFYGAIGKVLSGILCFIIYAVCITIYMAVLALIRDNSDALTDNKVLILGIFLLCAVLAVITRIISYKGVINCVRQTKIYKTKKSAPKIESYV